MLVALLAAISMYMNSGLFIYVLDDPYIHMTIARNFVSSGHWAANGLDFSSATSSPLWTLIISAIFFVTGPFSIVPFELNILFGILCICAAYFILIRFGLKRHLLFILMIFIFAAPLPALTFTGMEHLMQIFLALFFVYVAAKQIEANPGSSKTLILAVTAMLLTGLRYEDMFLVLVVTALLAVRRQFFPAVLVLLAGAAPVIVYGLISTSYDWLFVPNPILIKGRFHSAFDIIEILKILPRAVKRMLEPDILFIVPVLTFTVYRFIELKPDKWQQKNILLLIFVSVYLLHMTFAQTGWFFRYEAYLVSLGVIVLWTNIYDLLPSLKGEKTSLPPVYYRLKPILMILIVLSLAGRSVSNLMVPVASNNIYEQHYQMAMFVRDNANGIVIAANDIGMLGYYTPNKIVDLWGLADIDAAKLKIDGTYSTKDIEEIAARNNVKLAIIYEHWFDQYGGVPASWNKFAEWKMTKLNIVCGAETVAFYLTDGSSGSSLKQKLQKFSSRLPRSIDAKVAILIH